LKPNASDARRIIIRKIGFARGGSVSNTKGMNPS